VHGELEIPTGLARAIRSRAYDAIHTFRQYLRFFGIVANQALGATTDPHSTRGRHATICTRLPPFSEQMPDPHCLDEVSRRHHPEPSPNA
jgi:hypothetical protein